MIAEKEACFAITRKDCAEGSPGRIEIDTYNKNLEILKDAAKKEMIKITKWMDKMNFPIATAWKSGTSVEEWNENPVGTLKVDNYIRASGGTKDKKEKAQLTNIAGLYDSDIGAIRLPQIEFVDGKKKLSHNNAETLAHELSHGVHRTIGTNFDSSEGWITEGLPEAIGYAWVKSEYQSDNSNDRGPKYDSKLYEPKNDYERGHFFLRMGEDLNNKGLPMSYFPNILKNKITGNGIDWLDSYLKTKGTTLAEYYPNFINEHTNSNFFTVLSPQVWKVSVPSSQTRKLEGSVDRIAAYYQELNVTFTNSGNVEEKDRIYLLDLSIAEFDGREDLSLIVGKKLKDASEHHLSLVLAEDGYLTPPLKVKVPNVADDPIKTKQRTFELDQKVSPVSFKLPTCVGVGSSSKIKLNGISTPEFSQLEGVNLTPSDGDINTGLMFQAPEKPKDVKVRLSLPRSSGNSKTIELGEIKVTKDAWDVYNRKSKLIGAYSVNIGPMVIHGGSEDTSAEASILKTINSINKTVEIALPEVSIAFDHSSLALNSKQFGNPLSLKFVGKKRCDGKILGLGKYGSQDVHALLSVETERNGKINAYGEMVFLQGLAKLTWDIELNMQ